MKNIDENALVDTVLEQALYEDLQEKGDITSLAIFSQHEQASARITSKEDGVVSGTYLLKPLFEKIDKNITVTLLITEGEVLRPATEICRMQGPVRSILAGERIALNFLQRLSGIASRTSKLVSLLEGTRTKLLDTRKTTPLLRYFEKKAVVAGGGMNHRLGLYDMMLIKDTHVKASGGVAHAIKKAKEFFGDHQRVPMEVEVQSVEEFVVAAKEKPDRIMLDNMKIGDMITCVSYRNMHARGIELEASGNITEKNLRSIAQTGVDFISVGALTHSVTAVDIHLLIDT